MGFSISHPGIIFDSADLFRGDGVHLSIAGADLFLLDLQKSLWAFMGWGGVKR